MWPTSERLDHLDRAQMGPPPASADFESVLALALHITGCQAGLIRLGRDTSFWSKADVELEPADLPGDLLSLTENLCHAEPVFIENLSHDARFRDAPLVATRGARFYAGLRLGGDVGTLSLIGYEPRLATEDLALSLRRLARVIEGMLDLQARATQATGLAAMAAARERELWKKSHLIAQSERLAKVGAWEMDLATDLFFGSDEACRILEAAPGETLTRDTVRSLLPADSHARAGALFRLCLATGEGFEYRCEFRTMQGNRRWMHIIVEAERRDGQVVRVFGTIRDVTAEYMAEQELWRAAHYDTLTGAPNRHYWTTRLDQAFVRAAENQTGLTILMFDLDGFKEINDTRGHAAGDAVLRAIAKRLGETLPADAFHARLGGDEFAVLLEGSPSRAAVETLVRTLLADIQRPIQIEALRLQTSGTFGCASFPVDAATASDLMQKADIALYQAKRSHRTSFVPFRAEIGDLFNDKRHAIDLVAAAIEENRLVPYYQPKVDLKTRRPAGFEALCRIEAADGTILGPSHFLPALRDPASSARIGSAMLDLVTADIAAWLAADLVPGRVGINVTTSDFTGGDLDRRVLDRLAALSLPPTTLEIEVTENTILGREAMVVGEALQALRDQGLVIALDDFGTGYASLTHLRDAPIHYIKLDRSFIAGLGRNAGNAIIVRSIVDLGHSLGMRIVAEGIETKGQADFLRAIGCDEAQGFLYGRPMSRAATRAILETEASKLRDEARRSNPLHRQLFKNLGTSG